MKDELVLGGDFFHTGDGDPPVPEISLGGDVARVVVFGLDECRRDCLRWDTVSNKWCDVSSLVTR